MNFRERLRALGRRFRALAERDGDVYLPNFTPVGRVDYILIAMEPSLGRWASSPGDARAKIAAGFRNFMWSLEDFILHMSARQYLCNPGQTYHLTDVSKGAMLVKRATQDRAARYARWFDLLVQEIDLVAKPRAQVIAIGKAVADNLRALSFARPFATILHYSGQAGRARRIAVAGQERALRAFASTLKFLMRSLASAVGPVRVEFNQGMIQVVLRARVIRQGKTSAGVGRGRIPRPLRERLLAAERHRCSRCGRRFRAGLTIDHIVPLSLLGADEPGNWVALCKPDNREKWLHFRRDFLRFHRGQLIRQPIGVRLKHGRLWPRVNGRIRVQTRADWRDKR